MLYDNIKGLEENKNINIDLRSRKYDILEIYKGKIIDFIYTSIISNNEVYLVYGVIR